MTNRHRFTLKARLVEYKGGRCQVCGYSGCLAALDFHHVDPAAKEFAIGGHHTAGADRLRAELDKCVLLCSNCHRELHTAIEAVSWGWPAAPIITAVAETHRKWLPPQPPPDFSRRDWQLHHPKFADPARRFDSVAVV